MKRCKARTPLSLWPWVGVLRPGKETLRCQEPRDHDGWHGLERPAGGSLLRWTEDARWRWDLLAAPLTQPMECWTAPCGMFSLAGGWAESDGWEAAQFRHAWRCDECRGVLRDAALRRIQKKNPLGLPNLRAFEGWSGFKFGRRGPTGRRTPLYWLPDRLVALFADESAAWGRGAAGPALRECERYWRNRRPRPSLPGLPAAPDEGELRETLEESVVYRSRCPGLLEVRVGRRVHCSLEPGHVGPHEGPEGLAWGDSGIGSLRLVDPHETIQGRHGRAARRWVAIRSRRSP